jgi:hypothetical protein
MQCKQVSERVSSERTISCVDKHSTTTTSILDPVSVHNTHNMLTCCCIAHASGIHFFRNILAPIRFEYCVLRRVLRPRRIAIDERTMRTFECVGCRPLRGPEQSLPNHGDLIDIPRQHQSSFQWLSGTRLLYCYCCHLESPRNRPIAKPWRGLFPCVSPAFCDAFPFLPFLLRYPP